MPCANEAPSHAAGRRPITALRPPSGAKWQNKSAETACALEAFASPLSSDPADVDASAPPPSDAGPSSKKSNQRHPALAPRPTANPFAHRARPSPRPRAKSGSPPHPGLTPSPPNGPFPPLSARTPPRPRSKSRLLCLPTRPPRHRTQRRQDKEGSGDEEDMGTHDAAGDGVDEEEEKAKHAEDEEEAAGFLEVIFVAGGLQRASYDAEERGGGGLGGRGGRGGGRDSVAAWHACEQDSDEPDFEVDTGHAWEDASEDCGTANF
ncbi:hypothetical protein BDK51DRAFT_38146 [Blyttiomyces helicus]|uniref:Uncharacterized protein n=1 Tax=Blyttiomyces helicus TaxID=388810 RepID=A0A4P9VTN8_9FUNG|nr:hypothetical protein BDK51DRAFT_38146 [Blyttiomyces helicus]|eukprot:RKO82901.1 hypothetical protein BDK51DRAFT_38146 [Blyttiomyces helicus]